MLEANKWPFLFFVLFVGILEACRGVTYLLLHIALIENIPCIKNLHGHIVKVKSEAVSIKFTKVPGQHTIVKRNVMFYWRMCTILKAWSWNLSFHSRICEHWGVNKCNGEIW